jgi:hypothetical protein
MADASDVMMDALDRIETALAKPKLPADPEEMNADRARWAETAIRQFQTITGTDWDDCVKDLLCDLMHFCDRNTFADGNTGLDFDAALTTARMHYEAETTDPDEPDNELVRDDGQFGVGA